MNKVTTWRRKMTSHPAMKKITADMQKALLPKKSSGRIMPPKKHSDKKF